MRFEEGQPVEVDGRKGKVVYHGANEPHLVVVRYDDGGIFKVNMHRVRVLAEDAKLDDPSPYDAEPMRRAKEIAARRLPTNHGTVYREIAEYNEPGQRIVICELRDGWHVVEVYLTSGNTTQRTIREVVETLAEARAWARGRLGWTADELQERADAHNEGRS